MLGFYLSATILALMDDIFQWKRSRVRLNQSKGGYVVGVRAKRDVFKETVVEGARVPKPNPVYLMD